MLDTIQAAREAEAASKRVQKKGAFCLRVLKRSGEGVQFTARFDSGVFGVWAELEEATDQLSGRFPYKQIEALKQKAEQSFEGGISIRSRSLTREAGAPG